MTSYQQGFLAKCAERKVPEGVAMQLLKKAEEFPDPPVDGLTEYDVQPGDTVSQVMQNYGIPQRYLPHVLKANGLTEETARRIRPGQKLYLEDEPTMYDAFAKGQAGQSAVAPQSTAVKQPSNSGSGRFSKLVNPMSYVRNARNYFNRLSKETGITESRFRPPPRAGRNPYDKGPPTSQATSAASVKGR